MKLSQSELCEFGERGYVVVRDVIPPETLAAASAAIDRLVEEHPPRPGHVGQQFYWMNALGADPAADHAPPIDVEGKGDAGRTHVTGSEATAAEARAATRALLHDTPLEDLVRSLVEPGRLMVAFDRRRWR